MPCYWIVAPDTRTVEAYELAADAYRLVIAARGDTAVSLPPFPDLSFVPDSIWP